MQILKIIVISIILIGWYMGANYYEWTQFQFYTNRIGSLPSLPLYTLAFFRFFFLSFGLYFLFRFVHKNLANTKWLRYINIFYFVFFWLFVFFVTFYNVAEFADTNFLYFLPKIAIFINTHFSNYFFFLLYSSFIYFPFIFIWAIVAGFY